MIRALQALFLAGTALLLVVPGVYVAVPLLLALCGPFLAGKVPSVSPSLRTSWQRLLGGFALFALSGLLLNLFHGDTDTGAYERLLPFVILPALAWTIRAAGWTAVPWIAAVGMAAALAGVHAGYEYLTDPSLRAQGATGNPIKFGHSAVTLAALCIVAAFLYPFPSRRSAWRVGLVLAAGAAAVASLLSGSKGGWPALLLVGFVAAYLAGRRWSLWRRHALAAGVTAALVAVAMLAPASMVRNNIASGVNGAVHWFQSGGEVTEGSVSLRFQLWSLGLRIFAENPVLGAGVEGKEARWIELVATDPEYEKIGALRSADNDLVDALSTGGIVGAIGLLAIYLGAWSAFWPWRNHRDAAVMALARMGLILVPVYLSYGLSVSVTGTSLFRTLFVTFTVLLLSFITVRMAAIERADGG